MDELQVPTSAYTLNIPKNSRWRCELFGVNGRLVFRPQLGKEPNWFWRWMQWLAFGNKWIKEPRNG